jgi:hypothetical protein
MFRSFTGKLHTQRNVCKEMANKNATFCSKFLYRDGPFLPAN